MKLLLLLFSVISLKVVAQTPEEQVKTTINKMFEGMKNVDTQMLKNCFADSVIFQTIQAKEERVVIRNENVKDFIGFIAKQTKGAADERITFETVKVDGPLAIAWTPYEFYYNGKFSHCGVNSFQLVKLHGEWKIQYIIDTRRKQPCQ